MHLSPPRMSPALMRAALTGKTVEGVETTMALHPIAPPSFTSRATVTKIRFTWGGAFPKCSVL